MVSYFQTKNALNKYFVSSHHSNFACSHALPSTVYTSENLCSFLAAEEEEEKRMEKENDPSLKCLCGDSWVHGSSVIYACV